MVDLDDLFQRLHLGETDIMEEAAAQEGVGQLFFVVGGDDDDGAVLGPDRLACLVDEELHLIKLLQQIVRELYVGLVDLVDQQHDLLVGLEGLPQLALADVVAHVVHTLFAQLAVAQPADGVVLVKALLRAGGGLDVPLDHAQAKRLRYLLGKLGLAGPGLSLDQQGAFERDGGVNGDGQIVRGDVIGGAFEFHLGFQPSVARLICPSHTPKSRGLCSDN